MKISILSNLSCKTGHMGFYGSSPMHHKLTQAYITHDYSFPWSDEVNKILHSNAINILNPQQQLFFDFIDFTDDTIQILKSGNIHLVNLADASLIEDNSKVPLAFNRADIDTVGIGIINHQARQPVEYEKDGVKVGIIGFSCKREHAHNLNDAPSIFYTPFGDAHPIKDLIHEIKNEVDILVALIQWGSERPEPNDIYQQFAHALIDQGVDVIHGNNEHVYMGIEKYKHGLIIYDSGDFVDTYVSDNEKQNTPRSFIYELELHKDGIKEVTLTPVLLHENQLKKAFAEQRTNAIQLMQTISKNLGTTIDDQGSVQI